MALGLITREEEKIPWYLIKDHLDEKGLSEVYRLYPTLRSEILRIMFAKGYKKIEFHCEI